MIIIITINRKQYKSTKQRQAYTSMWSSHHKTWFKSISSSSSSLFAWKQNTKM